MTRAQRNPRSTPDSRAPATVAEFALAVLEARTLDGKLAAPPPGLADAAPPPGAQPEPPPRPSRPPRLAIAEGPAARRAKVPSAAGMHDPRQRARILHGLANHELQALELFAWALLRFPAAPRAFRAGLLRLLRDEQAHCRLYLERLAAHGGRFGDEPVTGYFWGKAPQLTTPARFVAAMCLTFENANLDHALELADAARAAGDRATAAVLERVHRDEIRHVRFGWRWLRRFREPSQSPTAAYLANVAWPLRPERARGVRFDRASRERAGLDAEFIDLLATSPPPAARAPIALPRRP